MGSVSSGCPTEMQRYATTTDELDLASARVIADVLAPAIEAWNAAPRDLGASVSSVHGPAGALVDSWFSNSTAVRRIASAFERADQSGAMLAYVVTVDDAALDSALAQSDLAGRLQPGGTWSKDFCDEDYWYSSSGRITGPDGQVYDIVVPWVKRDGGRVNAGDGVADLDGHDPGWTVVGTEQGTRVIHYNGVAAAAAGAVTFGGGNEMLITQWGGVPADESSYADLTYDDDGRLTLPVSMATTPVYESHDTPEDMDDRRFPPSQVFNGLQFGVDMANGGLSTLGLLQDAATFGYCVVYEVNDDGRRRARIYNAKLMDSDGKPFAYEAYGTVTAEGDLGGEAMVLPEDTPAGPLEDGEPAFGITDRTS